MKFVCEYAELVNNLVDMSSVVEDPLSNEEMRNIIFKFEKNEEKNKVTLIGVNQIIIFKRPLREEAYSVELDDADLRDGIMYMQIKSKDLLSCLNSYKTLRRTRADEITLTLNERGKMICNILEKDTSTEQPHISVWEFNNLPIKESVRRMIIVETPTEGVTTFNAVNILFHTRSLLPILVNTPSLYGSMMIGEDYVVGFNAAFIAMMQNQMKDGGIFKDIKLSYRAIAFMDKVICNGVKVAGVGDAEGDNVDWSVDIARTDERLYFRTANSEAFIIYDTKLAEYKPYISMFKRDHKIVLDRWYLKDVLKHVGLVNETVEVTINLEDNVVYFKNSKSKLEVMIDDQTGMEGFSVISFKVMPDILSKAIIGSDVEFEKPQFQMWVCPNQNGNAVIVLNDTTNMWYSLIKVKVQMKEAIGGSTVQEQLPAYVPPVQVEQVETPVNESAVEAPVVSPTTVIAQTQVETDMMNPPMSEPVMTPPEE